MESLKVMYIGEINGEKKDVLLILLYTRVASKIREAHLQPPAAAAAAEMKYVWK